MKDIKAKIKSVQNIQQITKALEIVSTIKFQKVKEKTEAYKIFMEEFLRVYSILLNSLEKDGNGENNKVGKELVLVVGTDKGLCGSLNNKLFKKVFNRFNSVKDKLDLYVIGKKTLEFFVRSGFNVVGKIDLKDDFSDQDLNDFVYFIRKAIDAQKYDNIYVAFNYFKNAMTQIPSILNLYPFDLSFVKEFFENIGLDFINASESKNIEVMPSVKEVLDEMKKQLIRYVVYGAILQNKAGEFASRMIAMKNAKDNAYEIIKHLQISFNKARQAAITQEVSEIVAAKMALEDN